MTTIGVLGGTGPAGSGIALRLAAAGHDVVIGSREAERGGEVADGLRAAWSHDLRLRGGANTDAANAEIVVLAAPWQPVLRMAPELVDLVDDRIVVSMANALERTPGGFLPLTMPRGSVTAEVQAQLPRARVVGAFHHLPASVVKDLDRELACDVLVAGEDPDARRTMVELVDGVDGLRGIDAGGLASAGAIEAMTAVLVQVNVTYRTHSMPRLEGSFDR